MDQEKAHNLNLFLSQGNKWKRLRALTSNVLTTAKIKSVDPILRGVMKEFMGNIEKDFEKSNIVNLKP
jgi:cytochrome P450